MRKQTFMSFLIVLAVLFSSSAHAVLNSTDTRIQYTCNGTTTTYAYDFKILEDDDLNVTTDDGSTETTLVLNTDYTVTGAGDAGGGNVVLTAGDNCSATETLTILRNVDLTQDTDYVDGESFSVDSLEIPSDKLMMISQQQQEQLDRAPLLRKSSTLTNLDLPNPTGGYAIGWNASGDGLANISSSSLTVTQKDYVRSDETLAQAVTRIGSTLTTLLVDRGLSVADGTTVETPSTLALEFTRGGFIQGVAGGGTEMLTINGQIIAGDWQIFGDNLTVNGSPKIKYASIAWTGCVGDGSTDNATDLQRAITFFDSLFVPLGIFNINSAVTLKSGLSITGAGEGSIIAVGNASAYALLTASAAIDSVEISKVAFDGSLTYPSDRATTDKETVTQNSAIDIAYTPTNISIHHCYFNEFSNGSVSFNTALNGRGINISDNYFYLGNYRLKVISVYSAAGRTEATANKDIVIARNIINEGGPTAYYDPSDPLWTSSTDAIHLDGIYNANVFGNTVYGVSGIGVRVEESHLVSVNGNTIRDPGQSGISFYNSTFDCTASANTITGWGNIPFAYALRSYSGTNYIALEFPDSVDAPLPADPSASAWFEANPYELSGVNTGNIIAYNSTDYWNGTTGILPFRGYNAIEITNSSQRCAVSGNTMIGDISVDGSGDYYNSSRYGVTNRHPINAPVNDSGSGSTVIGNVASSTISGNTVFDKYQDTENERGTVSNLFWDDKTTLNATRYEAQLLYGLPLINSTEKAMLHVSTNDTAGAYVDLAKSRLNSSALASAGDVVGAVRFLTVTNVDGTKTRTAQISATKNGAASATDSAGQLDFATVPVGTTTLTTRMTVENGGIVTPGADATQDFGKAAKRWKEIYASVGAINTSDEREKQQIRGISAQEKAAASEILASIKAFKFNSEVDKLGVDAKIHFGVMAQQVITILSNNGLDPDAYAFIVHDSWDSAPARFDEDGTEVSAAIDAGDRYGIRYSELLAFVLSSIF